MVMAGVHGKNAFLPLLLLVGQTSTGRYSLVVCNSDPKEGSLYHSTSDTCFPKLKAKLALRVEQIAEDRITDPSFWFGVVRMMLEPRESNNVASFYQVLLPHLTDKPLHESVVEEGVWRAR